MYYKMDGQLYIESDLSLKRVNTRLQKTNIK